MDIVADSFFSRVGGANPLVLQDTFLFCRNRKAFTLIETLVVIAVVGMLLAVLLPAVQSAREVARRSECNSQLRQIGIALHNYAVAVGTLPQGGNGRRAYSLHAMVLPYLGESALYNSINFEVSLMGPGTSKINLTATSGSVAHFICPSDRSSTSSALAATSYAGNGGVPMQLSGHNGIFYPGDAHPVRFEDIKDGTSTTAMMSEWLIGRPANPGRPGDPRRLVFDTFARRHGPEQLEQFVQECSSISPNSSGFSTNKGTNWLDGNFSSTLYNHANSVNMNTCTNSTLVMDGAWTASSSHPGGANVLFADGGVSLVRDSIQKSTWRAIATRAMGESLSGEMLHD